MTTLIITDNVQAFKTASLLQDKYQDVELAQSLEGKLPDIECKNLEMLSVSDVETYGLILSLHCRQIFPAWLVKAKKCVNVHPGYNPYNRGWFPHVFSVINKKPVGVTIHEMDEKIDNGPIIHQEQCMIHAWDTSETLYNRIMELEREMVLRWFPTIESGNYEVTVPPQGDINLRKDFESIKELDLEKVATYREVIDHIRALSHGDHQNAFFHDSDGNKVYLNLNLYRQPKK